MTWTAGIMPDDALDPTSLVGRMLRPTTEESSAVEPVSNDQTGTLNSPAGVKETRPLWRVMSRAYDESAAPRGVLWDDHHGYAAEIDAIVQWLPAMPPAEIWGNRQPDFFAAGLFMEWVRTLLTEQARIARGDR